MCTVICNVHTGSGKQWKSFEQATEKNTGVHVAGNKNTCCKHMDVICAQAGHESVHSIGEIYVYVYVYSDMQCPERVC